VKSMQRVLIDILNAPFEVDLPYPAASGTEPHLAQFSSTSRFHPQCSPEPAGSPWMLKKTSRFRQI
jgi:hypothetical protein